MGNNFKDSFNYLVAFLAVLFGLVAFKDYASAHALQLFSISFTYLQICVPFVVLMLVAAYVGALAMLSRNVTFKLFPLTKGLELVSSALAAIGLMYPLIFGVTYLLSCLISVISIKGAVLPLASVLGFAQAVIAGLLATRYALAKQQDKFEVTLNELRERVYAAKTPIDVREISPYEIVMLYHQFISLSKSILNLKGYGISGENARLIGETLKAQGIFNEIDLKEINKVRTIRNRIVHPSTPVSHKDLTETKRRLEALIGKLKKVILSFDNTAAN